MWNFHLPSMWFLTNKGGKSSKLLDNLAKTDFRQSYFPWEITIQKISPFLKKSQFFESVLKNKYHF